MQLKWCLFGFVFFALDLMTPKEENLSEEEDNFHSKKSETNNSTEVELYNST